MKSYQIAFQLGAKMDSSVRNAFGKANRQINSTRQNLSNVAKTAAKASAAIVGAGAAVAGAGVAMANSFANTADEIDKQAMKAGVGATALQEYRYAMGQVGVEERDLQQALERTNRRYGQALQGNEKYREALKSMNVDLKDAQGNVRSTDAIFNDAIKKLGDMEDSQKASALATQFFGDRLGSQLLPAIEAGGEELERLKKEAHEMGGIIDKDGIKAATEWKGAMDKLKFGFRGFFNTVAMEALPGMQRFLDAGIDKIPAMQDKLSSALNTAGDVFNWIGERGQKAYNAVKDAIQDNFPNMKSFSQLASDTGDVIGDAFQTAKPYIDWFTTEGIPLGIDVLGEIYDKAAAVYNFIDKNWSVIAPIVAGITAAFASYKAYTLAQAAATKIATTAQLAMTAATKGFGSAITFATGPVGIIVLAIGALVAAGVALYKNWDTVKEYAGKTWRAIVSAIKPPVNTIIGFANAIIGAYERMLNAVRSVINKIPSFEIPDWVPGIGGGEFGLPKIPQVSLPKIPQLVEGGIATAPTLAMVGEGPEDEVISPISKLRDFINRPDSTTNVNDTDQEIRINYSPQINIEGDADREVIEQALDQDYERFKRFIERYFKDRKRLSFAE